MNAMYLNAIYIWKCKDIPIIPLILIKLTINLRFVFLIKNLQQSDFHYFLD